MASAPTKLNTASQENSERRSCESGDILFTFRSGLLARAGFEEPFVVFDGLEDAAVGEGEAGVDVLLGFDTGGAGLKRNSPSYTHGGARQLRGQCGGGEFALAGFFVRRAGE